jgi:hypothetical protein
MPMCVLFCLSTIVAAQKKSGLVHSTHREKSSVQIQSSAVLPRTALRILAIMVEFQEDQDVLTAGNGKFQLQPVSVTMIDPAPHDSLYFWNKLRFVKNYFSKVSNGVLTLSGDVYGQSRPIVLSKRMFAYSPPVDGADNTKLAELAMESWHKADSLYPEINFSLYDAFVIFHAGTGRDIDLVSALGFNPTPYDIPSLYLDSTAFVKALGSFAGIPVDGSTVFIKNSIVLPETESRIISTGAGDDTLQYSINGMFAASLGSFLGLPDLFNTTTGRSGIGQFGLMDGASIFAYNGLFPPAPCAWERITLGWTNPITITSSASTIVIPAIGKYTLLQDTIYKVPITQSEYFLVENRNRDPEGNGLQLTLSKNGTDVIRFIGKDTSGFSYYDAKGVDGSVVDVENYDWAIIGESDSTGKYDGGGILIWHIDEDVVQSGLRTNSVNADQNHRGVDLEEADGSKDIGQNYEFLTPGYGTENGSPLDCWFSGNSAIPYKNVFDKNSMPNSNSAAGAASLVTITNFSTRSPRMTFSIEIGNSAVTRLPSFADNFHPTSSSNLTTSSSGVFVTSGTNVYAFDRTGQSKTSDSTGLLSSVGGKEGIALREISATQSVLVGIQDSTVFLWKVTDSNSDGKYDSIQSISVPIGQRVYGPTMFVYLSSTPSILVHGEGLDFRIWQIGLDGIILGSRVIDAKQASSFTQLPLVSSTKPFEYYTVGSQKLLGEQSSVTLPLSSTEWILSAAVSQDGNFIAALAGAEKRLCAYNQNLDQQLFDITLPTSTQVTMAIADMNGDGSKDIVILASDKLLVVNRNGVMLDGFPVLAALNNEFCGTPLIADIDGDGQFEIMCFTKDGRLWTYQRTGRLVDGYPLLAGLPNTVNAAFFKTTSNTIGLVTIPSHGNLEALELQTSYNSQKIIWSQPMGTSEHINADLSVISVQPPLQEFLPKSRVYNWPNPVYGQTTHIRYYTSEDADVLVTILDLSGVKITELHGTAKAGVDNEILWNVANIQSGVYLARVEVQGASKSEVAFIKIAIVK